jgi:uroporphyrinogen-III synthase
MNGARVGITAHRRAEEQASLVRALGGVPVLGETLRADVPRAPGGVDRDLRAALAAPLDAAVFLSGIGVRLMLESARRTGLEDLFRARLEAAFVVARGAKPRRELRAAGLRPDWTAEPASTLLIRDALLARPMWGRRVLVQAFAEPPLDLVMPLGAAGAETTVVAPYDLAWPDDPEPARRLARAAAAGDLDAVTFTTARAARQFVAIAEAEGIDAEDLRAGGALMVAVGEVTRAALEEEGLEAHVVADPPKMGTMYRALAAALSAEAGAGARGRPVPAAAG